MGLLLVVALAFVADGIGLSGTQSFVAVGMSLGVGWGQRTLVAPAAPAGVWLRATMAGLIVPFLVFDLLAVAGAGSAYSLPLATAAGGGLAGWLQARRLGGWTTPSRWVGASTVGWALGAGAAYVADTILRTRILVGIPGLLAYLGLAASGGLLLGLVTARGFRE